MPSTEVLFFSGVSIILSLILGVIIGWVANDFLYNFMHTKTNLPQHPEMYDEHGNLIPDEILAVRFEQHDTSEEATDEDDD